MGFRLVPVYKRVWYFRGEKPKGFFFWSNKKLNLFGALIDGKKIYYEFFASINSLIEDLHAKLNQNKDKATQASIKKVRSQIQESLGHLEGADKSLNELNIELTIEELEEADKDIN